MTQNETDSLVDKLGFKAMKHGSFIELFDKTLNQHVICTCETTVFSAFFNYQDTEYSLLNTVKFFATPRLDKKCQESMMKSDMLLA